MHMKMGIDDYLAQNRAWPREAYFALERVPLTDAQFKPYHAWLQQKEARETEQQARKTQELDGLEITETAGGYTVRLPQHAVTLTFDRLKDARDTTSAELTATLGATELLSAIHLNLKSNGSQTQLVKDLRGHTTQIPWKQFLQKACSLVLTRHRHGEPIIVLEPSASAHVPFLLNPIIYARFQSLIYAPGGSCKSYLALWMALLVCHGVRQAGLAGVKTSVLYLDWELNAETMGVRLKQLQAGHPELSHVRPYYRRCELPLIHEVQAIATFVREQQIGLVVVDSAAMACGAELHAPESAIALQRALRKINCASLVLAHIAKATPDGHAATAYGTVFFRELARNVFELSKANDENPVRVVLDHTKPNFGPKQPLMGFIAHVYRGGGAHRRVRPRAGTGL